MRSGIEPRTAKVSEKSPGDSLHARAAISHRKEPLKLGKTNLSTQKMGSTGRSIRSPKVITTRIMNVPAMANSGSGAPSQWSLRKTIQYDNRKNYLPSKQVAGANGGQEVQSRSDSPSPQLRLTEESPIQLKKPAKKGKRQ